MDSVDFARRVLRRIDEDVLAIDATILSGSLPDYAGYRHQTGRRAGFEAARALIVDQLGPDRQDLDRGA